MDTNIMNALDIMKTDTFQMPFQKLQYIRSKGDLIKDENGTIVRHEDGTAKRTRGCKKGVMIAFVDPENESKVSIGYSLCHKRDRFDYRQGFRLEGLGVLYALQKADKHRETGNFIISFHPVHKQYSKSTLKIPQSISDDLKRFINRCKKYYKDKEFPEWAIAFSYDAFAFAD